MGPQDCLMWCVRFGSIGIVMISLERLYLHELFKNDGPLGWDILRRRTMTRNAVWIWLSDCLFRYPAIVLVYQASLFAALGLVFCYPAGTVPCTLMALVVCAQIVLSNIRSFHWGRDGSHNMLIVVFGALVIQRLAPASTNLIIACLWFLALQGCLAYSTSGLFKLREPSWRHGTAILEVLHEWPYCRSWSIRVFEQRPVITKAMTYLVLVTECAFPAALIVGGRWCWLFLGSGLLFHVAMHVVLRLNHFAWAYGATYPAIYYCAASIEQLASRRV
jgi:hypothetical protein